MAIVSSSEIGAQEFLDTVWKGGELFIDEDQTMKKALGERAVRSWWLLKPWVLKDVLNFARRFGSSTADISDPKTNLLGGTFVVKNDEVAYVHRETSSFDNGSAKEVLAAVLGKSSAEIQISPTPPQEDSVCIAKPSDGSGTCS